MGTCASNQEKTAKNEKYTTKKPIHQQKNTLGPEKKKENYEEANAS